MILPESLVACLAGGFLGLPMALLGAQALQAQLFGVGAFDPITWTQEQFCFASEQNWEYVWTVNKRRADDVLLELAKTQSQLVEELIEVLRICRGRYLSLEKRVQMLERRTEGGRNHETSTR